MVNYHTSTLLESSEHVFELIRYNFFWGAPPYHERSKQGKSLADLLSVHLNPLYERADSQFSVQHDCTTVLQYYSTTVLQY